MSADQHKRRWLPAFSVRTLLIAMTLLCAYAACWWPTKTLGVKDVADVANATRSYPNLWGPSPREIESLMRRYYDEQAVLPLVVRTNDYEIQRYYFWFFGYVVKLPYEREVPMPEDDAVEYYPRHVGPVN